MLDPWLPCMAYISFVRFAHSRDKLQSLKLWVSSLYPAKKYDIKNYYSFENFRPAQSDMAGHPCRI